MTFRRASAVAAAFAVLLLGAACGDRADAPLGAETDEPLFVQGKQLQKQSRHAEALAAFLKLIDQRGSRASAESHLEAGLIYLGHTKDPVEACHHFRRYLELQPNSKEAPLVRGKVEEARREFAKTLSARPLEDQSVRLEIAEELSSLRRERDELRAELAALRGTAAPPRSTMITVPDLSGRPPLNPPVAKIVQPLITPAPSAAAFVQPAPTRPAGAAGGPAQPKASATPPAAKPRTHTVAAGDTLYRLSRLYGVKVEAIAAANGMSVQTPLKVGVVLRIP